MNKWRISCFAGRGERESNKTKDIMENGKQSKTKRWKLQSCNVKKTREANAQQLQNPKILWKTNLLKHNESLQGLRGTPSTVLTVNLPVLHKEQVENLDLTNLGVVVLILTNQNSLFRPRDWLSANQEAVFPDSVGSY